jgi:lipopolysaccharide heptosyltransferase I
VIHDGHILRSCDVAIVRSQLRKITSSLDRKMKILLVRLGALGDIVHALPVAAALRERYPEARIDWLVDSHHTAIVDLVPVISRRTAVDSRQALDGLRTTCMLRRERYDVAIDVQGLVKSAAFARLSGAARVIGFDRQHVRERAASFFYTEHGHPGDAAHVIDRNLSLLDPLGITDRTRRFPIAVPASAALGPVAARGARDGREGVALVNPGAGWPNKRWPLDRFGEVVSWIASAHGLLSVVLWGPEEQEMAARIVDRSRDTAILAPKTGVGDLLALSRGARLMLSGDTGPLHLAAAVGTPIVALFGPTSPARNGPWAAEDISLSRYGDCVCRYERTCRRARACIDDISVDEVREAIDRRLADAARHD